MSPSFCQLNYRAMLHNTKSLAALNQCQADEDFVYGTGSRGRTYIFLHYLSQSS